MTSLPPPTPAPFLPSTPSTPHDARGSLAACPAGRKRLSRLAAAVRHLCAPVIREACAIAAAAESAPPPPPPPPPHASAAAAGGALGGVPGHGAQ